MNRFSDEKKCVIMLALILLTGLLLLYTYTGAPLRNDHEGIIRLHVIANSDSVADQALKLKVRDEIIEYMEKQTKLRDVEDTRKYLQDNLDRLERIAEGVIASEGYDYPAGAVLGVRYIPERTYGDITFPAGNYEALNITIGSGQGANWWCVLFPPLCILDEGSEATAEGGNHDGSGNDGSAEYSDSLTDRQKLELRWKVMELLDEGGSASEN